jgi:hypothetical protein
VIVSDESGLHNFDGDSAFSCYGAEQLSQTKLLIFFVLQGQWPSFGIAFIMLSKSVLLKIKF